MRLLIIIPAYNEADNIKRVVTELKNSYPFYDYVVVNDGSSDRTAQICREEHFHMISLPVNLGLAGAFRTGMKYAERNGYDCALQYDGDGQHDLSRIPMLLHKMEKDQADIVIGSRYVEDRKKRNLRSFGNSLIGGMIWLTTGQVIHDSTSGMRLYSRRMVAWFAKYINFDPEPDTVAYLIRCGAKVEEVQVQMRERIAGESYLKFWPSLGYMVRICSSILFMQWFRKKEKI